MYMEPRGQFVVNSNTDLKERILGSWRGTVPKQCRGKSTHLYVMLKDICIRVACSKIYGLELLWIVTEWHRDVVGDAAHEERYSRRGLWLGIHAVWREWGT